MKNVHIHVHDAEDPPRNAKGQFTAGAGASPEHLTLHRYLARQGSYSSSGKNKHYHAAKKIAAADPSLELIETHEPPRYDIHKRTGRGNQQGSYTKPVMAWVLRKKR